MSMPEQKRQRLNSQMSSMERVRQLLLATDPHLAIQQFVASSNTRNNIDSRRTPAASYRPRTDVELKELSPEKLFEHVKSMKQHFGSFAVPEAGDEKKRDTQQRVVPSDSDILGFAQQAFRATTPAALMKERVDYCRELAGINIALKTKLASSVDNFIKQNNVEFRDMVRHIANSVKFLSKILESCMDYRLTSGETQTNLPEASIEQTMCEDMRWICRLDQTKQYTAVKAAGDALALLRLRKFKGKIWRPVYREGQFLQAYEPFEVMFDGQLTSELSAIIAMLPTMRNTRCSPNWGAFVSGSEPAISKYFMSSESYALPSLELDNTLRAFKNGIYDMRADCFYPWADEGRPRSIAAAAYRNAAFPCHDDGGPYSLAEFETGNYLDFIKQKAPTFYRILEYQLPPRKSRGANTSNFNSYSNPNLCMRYLCAMIGRTFFRICLLDQGYECFLSIIGHGGTGKSKILDNILRVVPNHFLLKNKGEEIFGLEGMIGSELVAIEEVSKNSNVQPEFILQIGSSNGLNQELKLSVARKNKVQISIKATMPLVMVGNSAPTNIPNEQNQFQRRMRGILFDRPVPPEQKDPEMPQKMRKEFGAFLRGCVMAYHNM